MESRGQAAMTALVVGVVWVLAPWCVGIGWKGVGGGNNDGRARKPLRDNLHMIDIRGEGAGTERTQTNHGWTTKKEWSLFRRVDGDVRYVGTKDGEDYGVDPSTGEVWKGGTGLGGGLSKYGCVVLTNGEQPPSDGSNGIEILLWAGRMRMGIDAGKDHRK